MIKNVFCATLVSIFPLTHPRVNTIIKMEKVQSWFFYVNAAQNSVIKLHIILPKNVTIIYIVII